MNSNDINESSDPRDLFPTPPKHIADLEEAELSYHIKSGNFIGGHTMPWGSNYTFMMWIEVDDSDCIRVIYKPKDGEKPLYDFKNKTLYKRERASYVLSKILGWPNIPLTIIRNGPYGLGSVQNYIECDPRITFFEIREKNLDDLFPIAIFDLITNNADRKAGHCISDSKNVIWSIDHGLTFNSEFKLRTVMFEFCGKKIPSQFIHDISQALIELKENQEIKKLLSSEEFASLISRMEQIITNPMIPILNPNTDIPWPLV